MAQKPIQTSDEPTVAKKVVSSPTERLDTDRPLLFETEAGGPGDKGYKSELDLNEEILET